MRACSRMGARARVGLLPGGAGRPVGLGVGGACLRKRRLFEGAGFIRTDVELLLLLADNCHRDFWRSLRGHLQFSILEGWGLASPSTTLKLYGGTDYDLANSAIIEHYFSMVKTPMAFLFMRPNVGLRAW